MPNQPKSTPAKLSKNHQIALLKLCNFSPKDFMSCKQVFTGLKHPVTTKQTFSKTFYLIIKPYKLFGTALLSDSQFPLVSRVFSLHSTLSSMLHLRNPNCSRSQERCYFIMRLAAVLALGVTGQHFLSYSGAGLQWGLLDKSEHRLPQEARQ